MQDVDKLSQVTIQHPPKSLNKADGVGNEDIAGETQRKDNQLVEEKILGLKAERELRDRFSTKAYRVAKATLIGWAALLFSQAFCVLFRGIHIFSDNVLVALTTAVTLNVFAAFLGVIRGLFPVNGNTSN